MWRYEKKTMSYRGHDAINNISKHVDKRLTHINANEGFGLNMGYIIFDS